MEQKVKITCMTRYNNITYRAPKFHERGFIEYFIWKDEFDEKYIQFFSKMLGKKCFYPVGTAYFFSIKQYTHKGIFLGDIWGVDEHLKLKKIRSINALFTLKAVIRHYSQLMNEKRSSGI